MWLFNQNCTLKFIHRIASWSHFHTAKRLPIHTSLNNALFLWLLTISGAGAVFSGLIITVAQRLEAFRKSDTKMSDLCLNNWHAAYSVRVHAHMCLSEQVVFACVCLQACGSVFRWMSTYTHSGAALSFCGVQLTCCVDKDTPTLCVITSV